MIERMCLSETFSFATPFTFILIIPFILYYSFKTFVQPVSTIKDLPTHHQYRLPEFLISSHVDKSKYLRRRMKQKSKSQHKEQLNTKNNRGVIELGLESRKQKFLGRCSIGLEQYAIINRNSENNRQQRVEDVILQGSLSKYKKKNSRKKYNRSFEPTKLTIIHEDAQY